MKNLLNLSGAQKLSKTEQQGINGGHNCQNPPYNCPVQNGCICKSGVCYGIHPTCV